MTMIELEGALPLSVPREPKEMLTVLGPNHVRINFSSLDLIQTCRRKAYYVLERKLHANFEAPATIFGRAIHAALETWYCAPRASRKTASAHCRDSQELMLGGQPPVPHGPCVRCASVASFLQGAAPLAVLPETDKRSLSNGVQILAAYFARYAGDPFVVAADDLGPICERDFTVALERDGLRLEFFGRIDTVLRNEETGVTLVCDHKTTSSLGSDFLNRIKPNFQYIGYAFAAKRALGIDTDMFMVNGIQVAKTKQSFTRQVFQVTQDDVSELEDALFDAAAEYLRCRERGLWPMTAPGPCANWGGCQFRAVCEVPRTIRESVIAALFQTEGKVP